MLGTWKGRQYYELPLKIRAAFSRGGGGGLDKNRVERNSTSIMLFAENKTKEGIKQ
jgi:hypothetical protein